MPRATEKSTTTPAVAGPFPATVESLRALASARHGDAALLVACDRWSLLKEYQARLYKKKARGYMDLVREVIPEVNALHATIAATPARTTAGRRAKVEIALYAIADGGTYWEVARSVLQTALADMTAFEGA